MLAGTLRLLGRACTFDDLQELSNISAETHRRFFHVFVRRGAEQLEKENAAYERGDKDVLDQVERLYAANGFPGCIGSTDCVGVYYFVCARTMSIDVDHPPSHGTGRSILHGAVYRTQTGHGIPARRDSPRSCTR